MHAGAKTPPEESNQIKEIYFRSNYGDLTQPIMYPKMVVIEREMGPRKFQGHRGWWTIIPFGARFTSSWSFQRMGGELLFHVARIFYLP